MAVSLIKGVNKINYKLSVAQLIFQDLRIGGCRQLTLVSRLPVARCQAMRDYNQINQFKGTAVVHRVIISITI